MHSWVLREMVNEADKLLSIILEKSWQFVEVPTEWKRGNKQSLFKKAKKELQACQSHLCAQQDCGINRPENKEVIECS